MRWCSPIIIVIVLGALIAPAPRRVVAQTAGSELPFGGIHAFITQCTCGPDSLHYIFDYTSNRALSLLFEPYSRLYENFNIQGGTYQLGTYQPSGQQCMMTVGTGCVGIHADGTYGTQPGTGTTFFGELKVFASVFAPVLGAVRAPPLF